MFGAALLSENWIPANDQLSLDFAIVNTTERQQYLKIVNYDEYPVNFKPKMSLPVLKQVSTAFDGVTGEEYRDMSNQQVKRKFTKALLLKSLRTDHLTLCTNFHKDRKKNKDNRPNL